MARQLALGSGSTPRRFSEVAEDFRAATIRTGTTSAGNVAQRKFVMGGVEYLSVLYNEKSRFARRRSDSALGLVRQKPADECSAAQHNNEVNAVALADHIGGPRYRFICRAARCLTKISDKFVNDAILGSWEFHNLRQEKRP